jgi:transcriptional regulator with XRE-family HTH domain
MDRNYWEILKFQTMTNKNTARKYSSSIAKQLLEEITPLEKLKASNKMVLAAKLDDYITAKGWSKSEFAEKVGKSPSVISKWLSGTHNFEIDTLAEIAIVLEKPVAVLFAEKEVQTIYKTEFVVAVTSAPPSIRYATPYEQMPSSKGVTSLGTYSAMLPLTASLVQA